MILNPKFSPVSNSIKFVTWRIFDLLLMAASILLGWGIFVLSFLYLPKYSPPVFLLLGLRILLLRINLLAWSALKSWKMWAFGFSLLVLPTLLFILAFVLLPNPYVVENPSYLAAGIVIDLVFLFSVVLWVGRRKAPVFSRILLAEFAVLGFLALV